MKHIVFSDFDGTISADETFVAVLKQFAPALSERILPEIYALRLSLREGIRTILESIDSARYPDILAFIRHAPLRPGFLEFLDFLEASNTPLIIVSGGLSGIVKTILGPLLQRIFAIYAPDVDLSGAKLKVISPKEGDAELVDKAWVIAQYPDVKPICIGNSVTDINMSMACSDVFACDRLIGYLKARNKSFYPFTNFFDIRDQLATLWVIQEKHHDRPTT